MWQQPLRGNYGARIYRAQILGEASHHAQAIGPLSGLRLRRLSGPFQGQLCGHEGRSLCFGKAYELSEQTALNTQFETELAAKRQIVL